MNYYSDEKEWIWLFKNAINWDDIIPLYYPTFPTEDGLNSKEEVINFLEELLSTTGNWAGNALADRASRLDKEGPGKIENGRTIPGTALEELYSECKELGIFSLIVPRSHGGMELPVSLYMIVADQVARACLSSSAQVAFYTSIGEMIHKFCSKDHIDKYLPRICEGSISGAMCLTEPGAGSDLGAIRTTATPQEDGTYLINGTKSFITNGGGGLNFTLAKIKGEPDNLDGISMFFIEQFLTDESGKEYNNFNITKNEDKMGLHGSFTCEIVYENSKAYLVREKNKGFKYMLHLMNEARLAVGVQALGGIEGCLYHARKYAEERTQFNKLIQDLPLLKRNLEDYETERDAIRALIVDTCSYYDIFQKLDYKKDHGELTKGELKLYKQASIWVRKRTPLIKYYSTEAYTTISQRAIQILGGYGFMKEYPVERYHRDSFATIIYEGTSQIQALMALKDIMKYAMKDPKKFFSNIFFNHPIGAIINAESTWTKDFTSIHYKFKKRLIGLLIKCLRPEMDKIFDAKSWMSMEKMDVLMTHAETVCQALSYMETLRVLCYHANKDESRAKLFSRYKILILPRLEAIYTDWSLR